MFARMLSRRVAVFAMMVLSAAVVAACGDDPVEESDPADSIVTMTLVVGGKTITVSKVTGVVTGGPIVIGTGTTSVTFSFQDASGATVTGLGEFEVQGTPVNSALVTFAKNGFSGTLTRVAAGSTAVKFGLWHIAEGHFDFGPYDIPITIQ